MRDLNEEEKQLFADSSLENLFHISCAAQRDHEENSRSRAVFRKLEPFVAAIEQYGHFSTYTQIPTLSLWFLYGAVSGFCYMKDIMRLHYKSLDIGILMRPINSRLRKLTLKHRQDIVTLYHK
jgi:hypothetical protein